MRSPFASFQRQQCVLGLTAAMSYFTVFRSGGFEGMLCSPLPFSCRSAPPPPGVPIHCCPDRRQREMAKCSGSVRLPMLYNASREHHDGYSDDRGCGLPKGDRDVVRKVIGLGLITLMGRSLVDEDRRFS